MSLISLFVLFLIIYCVLRLLEKKRCKNIASEPPIVYAWIPILGHLLGLLQHGVSYYRMLREKTNTPIFTLFLAFQKVYVVNSPALISQINRRQKVIDSNPPFLTIVMGKLFDFPKDDMVELLRNPNETGSLRHDTRTLEHSLLERGAAPLYEILTAVMRGVADRLSTLASEGPVTINLERWLREIFTLSTAQGVFGPQNPFTGDPGLLHAFWQFESGIKGLTMGIFPALTAAGPARARHRLVRAFTHFVQEDLIENREACELIRQIGEVARRHNRDNDYLARYYFGVFCAFLLNTVPVTFWTISHIIRDPELLARIRTELEGVARQSVDDGGTKLSRLDMSMVRERCPLLLSTFQETLRYVGASTSTLVVHEDVWLDNTYLLTKGSLVQIPATAVHSDPNTWGPSAAVFDPGRFVVAPSKVHPSANRTFGGGNTLCPGRHLASDEVLAFTAIFLYTFDVEFATETPRWPRRDETNMLSIIKPRDELSLRLTRRSNMQKAIWEFEMS